jgi:hypothetical protein
VAVYSEVLKLLRSGNFIEVDFRQIAVEISTVCERPVPTEQPPLVG